MYQQSAVAFTAFFMLLVFFTSLPASSAHPISIIKYGTAEAPVPIISDNQESAPTPTPISATTTIIILPRDNGSETSSSSFEETQSEEDDEDTEYTGLNPNAIAGIAVGLFFCVLLLIAAFMWAFRVGWVKGQIQKEKDKEIEMAGANQPAVITPQQLWQLVDDCIAKPPSAFVDTTGNSCWDSESWDRCDEYAENHLALGERYSFRPGMGVYEITGSKASIHHKNVRTDSGLGMESTRKAKGKEPERLDSPSANV